jgi:hypothetical protein
MPKQVTSRPATECINCHDRFSPKELAVDVREDDGEGAGKVERWCPQCFVGIRAPKDQRWALAAAMGLVRAIHCLTCGVKSVDFGRRQCAQCGSRRITSLLPKGTIIQEGDLETFTRAMAAAGARPALSRRPLPRHARGIVRRAS